MPEYYNPYETPEYNPKGDSVNGTQGSTTLSSQSNAITTNGQGTSGVTEPMTVLSIGACNSAPPFISQNVI